MEEMRLQKFLAQAGISSRRKAEEIIRQGLVKVNGNTVTEMGFKIKGSDNIEVSGRKVLQEEKKVYIMLNKPTGYVTTVKDQFSRPTVIDLLKEIHERVYPVGRLDYDTSGLLILTNDGDFTYQITHPKHEHTKVYSAEIEGMPTQDEISRFEKGLKIKDYITAPSKLRVIEKGEKASLVEITIHEGKNRQVRLMCDVIGHPVRKLKRIAIGNLKLGDLQEGKWRFLTEHELKSFF